MSAIPPTVMTVFKKEIFPELIQKVKSTKPELIRFQKKPLDCRPNGPWKNADEYIAEP